jgi:hypothetical protein
MTQLVVDFEKKKEICRQLKNGLKSDLEISDR